MPSACSPSSQILQDLVWLRIKLDHASALYGRFLKLDYPKPLVFPWILTYFGWFWGPHFRNPPYPCFASRLPKAYIGIYFKDVTDVTHRATSGPSDVLSRRFFLYLSVSQAATCSCQSGRKSLDLLRFWEACAKWSRHCRSVRSWGQAEGSSDQPQGRLFRRIFIITHHISISSFTV